MDINAQILALGAEYEEFVIGARRCVHTYAETAAREVRTRELILETAQQLELPARRLSQTGVIVRLETPRLGPVVALRADMDALAVAESETNLVGCRTCRSETPETSCHACGHDAHTAMLLGAMQILARIRDRLRGTVLFCFEEGEESGTGVHAMLEALEEEKVDMCWAIHVYAGLEEGKLSVESGARMAGAARAEVTFHGKSGHVSQPELAANPIVCGAAFLNNLASATAQKGLSKSVNMGWTVFQGGSVTNVIPETARLAGSYRYFDGDAGETAVALTKEVARHTAAMYGCRAEFPPDLRSDPTINDAARAQAAYRALESMLPAGTLTSCPPWPATESFHRYLKRYPGVLAFLGIRNPEAGYGAPHHNPRFDLNEKVLKTGAVATARVAAAWLGEE